MKNSKRPKIIIYKEGKKYNSVDDMERRCIRSLHKDQNKKEFKKEEMQND